MAMNIPSVSWKMAPPRGLRTIMLALAACIWLLLPALPAHADARFGVYVDDGANMLSPAAQAKLYQNAVWLHDVTGSAQVGVVTVKSLDGGTIEETALSTFRRLGLGGKERNDGVLLLYAAQENRVRIEVGYGLEGAIPDGKAGAILDEYFLPNMRKGNVDDAFIAAQTAIIRAAASEYDIDPAQMDQAGIPRMPQTNEGFLQNMPIAAKIIFAVVIVFLLFIDFRFFGGTFTWMLLSLLGRRGGGGGFGGGRGGGGSSGGGGASR
ncbi:MAG TPA: TPM domain-containing protein [Bacilli bacterium]